MAEDPISFSPFEDASVLLGKPEALQALFSEQGYVYLPGLLDTDKLYSLRSEIAQICEQTGWLKPGTPADELQTWIKPTVEGEDEYFKVYDRIQRSQNFHALAHDPAILSVMQTLLGRRSFPHPLSVARLMFPFNTPWATPPHQDYANNQGTEDLLACWIPLGDCAMDLGPLAVAPASHRQGLLPLQYALGAGHRQAHDDSTAGLDWVSGPMSCGDVLIFHSLTVHRSLANNSERLRLSVDYRYQREGDQLVEQSLKPHFQRESWDDIYAGWDGSELQYYWEKLEYELVPWNDQLHDLIDEPMQQQVAIKRQYDQYRDRVAQRFQTKRD